MSGGLLETTGWSPTKAAERAALHVGMCLAEGGFARIVTLGDGRVCWVGPDNAVWRHRPDGYRQALAEEATRSAAERKARKDAERVAHKAAVATKRLVLAANARKAMLAKAKARKAERLKAKAAEKAARREVEARDQVKARPAVKRKRRAKPKRVAKPAPAAQRPIAARDAKRAIKIMAETSARHGVSVSAMIGLRGSRKVVTARREAMWLIRELRDDQGEPVFTLQRLGRLFRRHASTVHTELGLHAARSASPEDGDATTCDQAWRPAA